MKKIDTVPNKNVFFISYRRNTCGSIANAVADKLEDRYKFEVFFDKHDRTVGEVEDKLKDAIDKCTHFILFVDENTFIDKGNQESKTNQSKDNDYVLFEIQQALKKRKSEKSIEIIPILVNGYKMPSKNDKRLANNNIAEIAGFEWIDYDEKNDSHNDVTKKILERIGYDEYKEMRHKDKVKKIKLSIVVILSAAAFLFGGTLLQKYITSKTPKLIFAGGGSVANMIKEVTHESVDIKTYSNSLYLDLPSENAWALMPEEVMIDHTSVSCNKFYPVCLSALEAKPVDSVFLKIFDKDEFMKKGTIISYKLGEDTLIVYSNINKLKKKSIIEKDSLLNIIKECCKGDAFRIYITQKGSGTYSIYKELFPIIFNDTLYSKKLTYYKDEKLKSGALDDDKENGYIILSSRYYTPTDIENLSPRIPSVMIMNKKDTISKPMYLYFAGYNRDEDSNITIPEEMVCFLNKIDPYFKKFNGKEFDTIIKSRMFQRDTMVVTPFETLRKWEIERNGR